MNRPVVLVSRPIGIPLSHVVIEAFCVIKIVFTVMIYNSVICGDPRTVSIPAGFLTITCLPELGLTLIPWLGWTIWCPVTVKCTLPITKVTVGGTAICYFIVNRLCTGTFTLNRLTICVSTNRQHQNQSRDIQHIFPVGTQRVWMPNHIEPLFCRCTDIYICKSRRLTIFLYFCQKGVMNFLLIICALSNSQCWVQRGVSHCAHAPQQLTNTPLPHRGRCVVETSVSHCAHALHNRRLHNKRAR